MSNRRNDKNSEEEKTPEQIQQEIEERRKLRTEQRDLHHKILSKRENSIEIDPEQYELLRDSNNKLFEKAKHSREQLLDAENLKVLIFN